MSILKLEKNFSENFKALSNELNKLFEKIINYGKVDLIICNLIKKYKS